MWGTICAAVKAIATALGWAKQTHDENTGVKLQEGKVDGDELKAIRDDRARDGDPDLAARVRRDHGLESNP